MSNEAYNFHPADQLTSDSKPMLFTTYGKSNALAIEVLSGLNQGEQLKIDESPIVIGGSDDCDLYLVEPNIKLPCLVIEKIGAQVCVRTLKDSCNETYLGSNDGLEKIHDQHMLEVGEKFCVGGVWFRLFDTSKKTACPSTKVADNEPRQSKITMNSLKKLSGSAEHSKHYQYTPRQVSQQHLHQQPQKKKAYWDIFKAGSIVMSSLCICALSISAAQGFSQTSSNELSSPNVANTATSEIQRLSIQGDIKLNSSVSDEILIDTPAPAVNEMTDEQLRYLKTVFSNMLIERELPQTLELSYDNNKFKVKGILAAQKEAILDRMISRFKNEQGLLAASFELNVKPGVSALPFEIIQVTSGKYGNIVTDSGKRLFVGDTQAGYQLVAIQDHQLVFAGKSRITVSW